MVGFTLYLASGIAQPFALPAFVAASRRDILTVAALILVASHVFANGLKSNSENMVGPVPIALDVYQKTDSRQFGGVAGRLGLSFLPKMIFEN